MLQFLLGLSDGQAAEAVRCRIDFTYAMAMELDDPGFHHSAWRTSAAVSLRTAVPTASWTSHWPGSRKPNWYASAPRSAPTPPMSWPRCVI
ncbi:MULTISPECIES: transposase [Streptomyces]|uniref:Transposase n=1 Tax=Streptomyces noboritoensis TaxID=67337 RepID=A0ABV6T8W5_9ACTN